MVFIIGSVQKTQIRNRHFYFHLLFLFSRWDCWCKSSGWVWSPFFTFYSASAPVKMRFPAWNGHLKWEKRDSVWRDADRRWLKKGIVPHRERRRMCDAVRKVEMQARRGPRRQKSDRRPRSRRKMRHPQFCCCLQAENVRRERGVASSSATTAGPGSFCRHSCAPKFEKFALLNLRWSTCRRTLTFVWLDSLSMIMKIYKPTHFENIWLIWISERFAAKILEIRFLNLTKNILIFISTKKFGCRKPILVRLFAH